MAGQRGYSAQLKPLFSVCLGTVVIFGILLFPLPMNLTVIYFIQ
jgi:hypothetical protein